MMFTQLRKATVACVAAGALLLGGLGGAAHATPDSLVDANKKGNIHLVKYDDSQGLQDPTGLRDSELTAKPLDGIKFSLRQVTKLANGQDISVNKNAQIPELAKLKAADIVAKPDLYGLTDEKLGETKDGGKIDWMDLKVGVYLLTEEDAPVSNGESYDKSAPALIFLPTTDPKGDTWIYEDNESKDQYAVWVYPKNSKNLDEKTVKDANVQVGQRIEYTISASVPAVTKLETPINFETRVNEESKPLGPSERQYNLKQFAFLDNLDRKLKFTKEDVGTYLEVSFGVRQGDPEEHEKLTQDDYAALVQDDGTMQTGQTIKVLLTETGLTKVSKKKAEVGPGTDVFVDLTFKPVVEEAGIVPNTSFVFKNTGEGGGETEPTELEPDKGRRTNTTVSAWGQVKIIKKDNADRGLNGAKFTVYGAKQDGSLDETKVIKDDVETKRVNDVDGIATVNLHVNDVADDLKTGTEQYPNYYLVETKAPDGYELNREPIRFKVELFGRVTEETKWEIDAKGNVVKGTEKSKVVWATGEETISGGKHEKIADIVEYKPAKNGSDKVDAILSTDQEVINIPVKPKLPMTGGAGVALFGLIGLVIIGGGVYVAKRNAKKA